MPDGFRRAKATDVFIGAGLYGPKFHPVVVVDDKACWYARNGDAPVRRAKFVTRRNKVGVTNRGGFGVLLYHPFSPWIPTVLRIEQLYVRTT